MTEFGIKIDDGSETINKYAIKENSGFIELYDWQRRAIKYFFKNNCVTLFEVTTGCLVGDTYIEMPRDLKKHPKGKKIKDLVGKKDFYVYTFNIKTNIIELSKVKNVWLNKKDADVFEITTETGKKIIATKNHPFLIDIKEKPKPGCGRGKRETIVERVYKKLEELEIGDYLTTFNRSEYKNNDGELIRTNYNKNYQRRQLEHRIICEQIYRKLNFREIVHHKDQNRFNNCVENLIIMDSIEHNKYHTKKNKNYGKKLWKNNIHPRGMFGKKHDKKTKYYISRNTKLALNGKEYIQYKKPIKLSLFKKYGFKGIKKNLESIKKSRNSFMNKSKDFRSMRGKIARKTRYSEKIIDIKYIGKQDVYDMEVEKNHNFIANGIVVHNSGKTFCAIELIKRIWEKHKDARVLIVVPKNVIMETGWYQELYQCGVSLIDIGVYYGHIKEMAKVTITNMQNLAKIDINNFDCCVFDECFSGDTKILCSDNKYRNLKNIVKNKLNILVKSYNIKNNKIENKPIINWYKIKEKRKVLDIELEDGTIITVTPEQKIYNGKKYIEANKLKKGDELLKIK